MKAEKVTHNKRIRKGDKIIVVSGNDRGLIGEVLSRTDDKVTVKGVNVKKKHFKKSQQDPAGGIREIERPFHISNVVLCVDEEKPRKVKVSVDPQGRRLLVYREGGTDVPVRPIKKIPE